jgi:hypothetical protein
MIPILGVGVEVEVKVEAEVEIEAKYGNSLPFSILRSSLSNIFSKF